MQTSKTFRLFISSTFNDFRREREILQTEVFPYIRKYCSKKGYTFQPIDLRWGINEEAQLDQKTLQMCLDEVRTCKSYPYPNFLLMLGDRYGWVPLPYAIESKEFEEILKFAKPDEKELLLEWYKEDLNQLPASYILKERSGEYANFTKWEEIENAIRAIFQKIVPQTSLDSLQQRKYFISATEAEIEEGIIPYIHPTPFQKKLLEKNPQLEKVDVKHIFGFFRDVDKKSKKSDKFINEDYNEAQSLKKRVKRVLLKENVLHSFTKQLDSQTLDEHYLEEFKQRVIAFLESKVDEQIAKEQTFTPLEVELQAQEYFAMQKRQNFMGQEELLERIKNYIKSNEEQPLIVYGESGKGKSSLMAKAVEEVKNDGAKKVLFRFVGATPHSGSSKEILISLFDELGKDVRSEQDRGEVKSELLDISSQNQESFEQFSNRIYDEIVNLKDEVVVFIDAVDQLGHDDQFLWLPNRLPPNVKIVISTLEDKNYKEDSKYFTALKNRSSNLCKIKGFKEPTKLLYALLKQENRSIQKHQERYFLTQYKSSASPLYVAVAAQELKHWKSYDGVVGDEKYSGRVQDLADTQAGIIKEFINNLSEFFHHDKELVERVLGYIYASRDGLSESELLQLLSADKEFVKKVAPDTWHENKSGNLPVVIWARLYTQLKPFLSKKMQDGEELLYFFHREFEDTLHSKKKQKLLHETVIDAAQKMILENQYESFESNRWGMLYIALVTEYGLRYGDIEKFKEFSEFVANLNDIWANSYFSKLISFGNKLFKYNKTRYSNIYFETLLNSVKLFYQANPVNWAQDYILALTNLAISYINSNRVDRSFELLNQSVDILQKLYNNNPKLWVEYYTIALEALANAYLKNNESYKAIELGKKTLKIVEEFFQPNSESWINAVHNLSLFYYNNNEIEKAIELQEENLENVKKLLKKNPLRWTKLYILNINNLAVIYYKINQASKATGLAKESLKIIKKLYQNNPYYWIDDYTMTLNNLTVFYKDNPTKAIEYGKEALKVVESFYKKDPNRWMSNYYNALNNLAIAYQENNMLSDSIKLFKQKLKVVENLYKKNQKQYVKDYVNVLINLAGVYALNNELDIAKEFTTKSLNILKKLYKQNPKNWVEMYNDTLKNLTKIYLDNGEFNKALELAKENLNAIQKFYQDNPDRWLESYIGILNLLALSYGSIKKEISKAIKYEEEILKILKKHYKKEPYYWVKHYTNTLNNLALFYKEDNRLSKAIELEEENLKIRRELYLKNPMQWAELYTGSLENLAISYLDNNQLPEAVKLGEASFKITKELYKKDSKRWVKSYTSSLNNLALIYKKINRVKEAIKLEKENLKILKKLYENNPQQWREDYIRTLGNLAESYKIDNEVFKAVKLEENVNKENFEVFGEQFVNALNDLAFSYYHNNKIYDSIKLQEECLEIFKELIKYKQEWVGYYFTNLYYLFFVYLITEQTEKILETIKESHTLIKSLYKENPKIWAEQYIAILYTASGLYADFGDFEKAIDFAEEACEILEKISGTKSDKLKMLYLEILNSLQEYYKKINDMEKVKELREKIEQIKNQNGKYSKK